MTGTKTGYTTISISLKSRKYIQEIQEKYKLTPNKVIEELIKFYLTRSK